jgi:ABC-type multidrug transport system fused ATPase/permease subunit
MLSVLLRLTPVEDGVVLVDGTPIEEFDLSSYRSCFAYVPQEIHLFDASVRENILFGRPDATDDEIVEAAQAAFFDEVVDQLPDGYETIIGEGGASLSGGQARRLMLARAALRNSRILILDEPLSGLDPEARDHVAASVKSISVGRTTVVVNHVGSEVFDPDIVLHVGSGMVTDKITFRNRPSRVAHGADGA